MHPKCVSHGVEIMENQGKWSELVRLLESEWHGQVINRGRLRELASSLLPDFPDMRSTLGSILRRTAQPAE